MRIELTTKPWQGFVLPLAPYPHHVCIIYASNIEVKHYFLVRKEGVEPIMLYWRRVLSPLCIPFHHYRFYFYHDMCLFVRDNLDT